MNGAKDGQEGLTGQHWGCVCSDEGGLSIEKQLPLPSPHIPLKMCPSLPPPSWKGQMSGKKLIIVKGWRL